MQHLVAYYESVDQGAVNQPVAAVPDSILYVVGDQVRVPAELPFAGGGVCLTEATTFTDAQLRTPTLRDIAYPSLVPYINDISPNGVLYMLPYMPANPMQLTGLEQMEFWTNTDNTGAVSIYGLVWLQDGPLEPVKGPMFTVRATAAAALSAGQWVNSQLTFDQQLPVGDYQVVGMRADSSNLVAARLVFQGYPWRPGVPAGNGRHAGNYMDFRFGRSGVMGTFNNNVPPSCDFLGITDTSEAVWLDLIKIK